MIGHTDTVFDAGTVAERPFRIDGDRAHGPGVSDMKGGLLTGFFAVEVLQAAGFDGFGRITYVCSGRGDRIAVVARRHPDRGRERRRRVRSRGARENGDIVSSRKGVSDFRIEIEGRAAHAGVEPDRGRSAILEGALKTIALQALNGMWPGVTINVGVVGGTRANVIPERCVLEVDVRSPEESTFAEAQEAVRAIANEHTVADVKVTTLSSGWHRPMEKGEGGRASRISRSRSPRSSASS